MPVEVVIALITAGSVIAGALLPGIVAPAWKGRLDRHTQQRERSEQLISHYSEPLTRAAFDLQSRLYNILRQDFLQRYGGDEYGLASTLWLFGQFLAWVEIVRREVQVLDLGSPRRMSTLQRRLSAITDVLATDSIADSRFAIYRAEQRAIGDVMVVERQIAGVKRSDCMGYASFISRWQGDHDFARWFARLEDDLRSAATPPLFSVRLVLIQRRLIDLIDFLDGEWIRYPDPNERGKIPLPPGSAPPSKGPRSPHSIARFRYLESDPLSVFDAWATSHGLQARQGPGDHARTAWLPIWRKTGVRISLVHARPWVELSATLHREPPFSRAVVEAEFMTTYRRAGHGYLLRRCAHAINDLLLRFDRPGLPPKGAPLDASRSA